MKIQIGDFLGWANFCEKVVGSNPNVSIFWQKVEGSNPSVSIFWQKWYFATNDQHASDKYALAFIDIPPTIQLVPQKHVVSILKDEYENR